MADPIPNGTFVLDKKTGAPWRADRGRFAASFQNIAATDLSGRSIQPQCMLVTVGAKGARSSLNVNGEKIGKVEWGNKAGTVQTAQIVEHMGN
jgi:syntaxin-binding protein 5